MPRMRIRHICKLVLASAVLSSAAAAHAGWVVTPDLRDRSWTDSDGRDLRLSQLHAPLVVMTMAYTACRRVCGTTTLVLAELQKRLDARGIDADFVVVSFDPENDSPREWREYRSRRHLDRDNWHFLTGDEQATHKMARGLDLDFWSYHDHVVHDFRIVLFDARWHPLAEVTWDRTDRLDEILDGLPSDLQSVAAKP